MTKKQKLIIIGFFFFILVFFLIIKNHFTKEISEANDDSKVSSTITCSLIEKKDVLPLIDFSGRISATNKINIISEVNGISIINNSRFEIGEEFKKGDVLLRIQDDDIDLELKSKCMRKEIPIDLMNFESACRTTNILNSDRRKSIVIMIIKLVTI